MNQFVLDLVLQYGGILSFSILLFWLIIFGFEIWAECCKRRESNSVLNNANLPSTLTERRIQALEKKWSGKTWFVKTLKSSLIDSGLPIIALVIAFLSFASAERANQLAEKQLLPQFEIRKEFTGIDRGVITASSSESIIFENRGGLCYSPRDHTISFIEVSITKEQTNLFLIPLEDYFTWRKYDDCKKISISGRNIEHEYDDYNYAKVTYMFQRARSSGEIIFSHPVNFTKLTYQDAFGDYRTEYYAFRVVPSVEKLSNQEEWELVLGIYNTRKRFHLRSSGEEILEYIKTLSPDYQYSQ